MTESSNLICLNCIHPVNIEGHHFGDNANCDCKWCKIQSKTVFNWENDCPICLNASLIDNKNPCCILDCGHYFCTFCLLNSYENNKNCSLCNTKINCNNLVSIGGCRIFAKPMGGSCNPICLNVDLENMTGDDLLDLICLHVGFRVELIYSCRRIYGQKKLKDYGISSCCTIWIIHICHGD